MAEGKFNIGGGTNSVSHFNDNTLAIDDDVTWVHGKHQLAFGGEWVQNELNIGNAYESNGIFTFNGEYSGSGPNGGSVIGDQSLDFLQGTMSAFQQSKQQQNALRGPDSQPLRPRHLPHHEAPDSCCGPALGTKFHARRLFQSRQRLQYGRLLVEHSQQRLSQCTRGNVVLRG